MVERKRNQAVTECLLGKENYIFLLILKYVRLNYTHFSTMKISNKQVLQQTEIYYLSDIISEGFINIQKECTGKPSTFLVIGIFDWLRFRKNLLEWIKKLIMNIDDKIREEKTAMQYWLRSGKDIMILIRYNEKSRVIEQVKFINVF